MRLWQRLLSLFGKRTVRCKECLFCEEQWLSGLHGQGLYKFSFCQRLLHDCKVVDADVVRECEWFEKEDIKT